MHSVAFKIWTRVAVSISYDDNHYTTGTSLFQSVMDILKVSLKFIQLCLICMWIPLLFLYKTHYFLKIKVKIVYYTLEQ